jgi:hypothetical protein
LSIGNLLRDQISSNSSASSNFLVKIVVTISSSSILAGALDFIERWPLGLINTNCETISYTLLNRSRLIGMYKMLPGAGIERKARRTTKGRPRTCSESPAAPQKNILYKIESEKIMLYTNSERWNLHIREILSQYSYA